MNVHLSPPDPVPYRGRTVLRQVRTLAWDLVAIMIPVVIVIDLVAAALGVGHPATPVEPVLQLIRK